MMNVNQRTHVTIAVKQIGPTVKIPVAQSRDGVALWELFRPGMQNLAAYGVWLIVGKFPSSKSCCTDGEGSPIFGAFSSFPFCSMASLHLCSGAMSPGR